MRINLVRSIGVVVGVIVVLLVAPIVCAASMDMTTETHALIPQGSSTLDSSPPHHILMNTVGEQVTPNRPIPSEVVCLTWSPADLTIEPSPTEERPFQIVARDLAPPSEPIAYHCRNFLTSEEPPL